MPPQVNTVVTTANDNSTTTTERATYGLSTVTLSTKQTQVQITMNAEGELDIRVRRSESPEARKREIACAFMDPEASGDQALRVRWHEAHTASEITKGAGYMYLKLRALASLNR